MADKEEPVTSDYRTKLIWGALFQFALGMLNGLSEGGSSTPAIAVLTFFAAMEQKDFTLLWSILFTVLSIVIDLIRILIYSNTWVNGAILTLIVLLLETLTKCVNTWYGVKMYKQLSETAPQA